MHIYIYDEFVNTRKYDNLSARIETRITDLGLNGKIVRLGVMKNIQNAVENEIKRGAKTITAVGNNKTISQVAHAIIKTEFLNELNFNVPLGIIPIGKENNEIAKTLGIPFEEEACDVLSARRVEKIDIGQAGENFFISNLSINSQNTFIEIDHDYSIEINENGHVNIVNIDCFNSLPDSITCDPLDGKLEIYIKTIANKRFSLNKKEDQSFFSVKNIMVANDKQLITVDNSYQIKTPLQITTHKNRLSIIIGKDRKF